MDKELKNRWIEALRNGHYEQGQDQLRIEDLEGTTFCCLGVLCDIAAQDDPNIKVEGEGYLFEVGTKEIAERYPECDLDSVFCDATVFYDATDAEVDPVEGTILAIGLVPEMVAENWGLKFGNQNDLAKMNDRGSSFEEIADWIETHV